MLRSEIIREVRKFRINTKQTQSEMADKIGMSQSRFGQIERQEHMYSIDSFIAFVNGHGFDLVLKCRQKNNH